ncbi:MAG: biotin/lipoyl-binding protein [Clostridia bacterium]|nr:biotin/lipoyl-binding protein [Clostridia bacterium]
MKKYNVTVNGTSYEITLEVVDAANVKAAPAPTAAPAPAAPAPVAAPAGGETVASPMPGTILSVNVQNGASVKKGDVLMILEAMKMENEIIAPCDGTIASVNVQNGASVETGATLCVIA